MKKILMLNAGLLFAFFLSAQVFKTIDVETPGTLGLLVVDSLKKSITDLKLSGNIDARDVMFMRDSLDKLANLDLSLVTIQYYIGYPANQMPHHSFTSTTNSTIGKYSLRSVILPNSATSIGDYAFGGCYYLKSVSIPNSVKSIGICSFYHCPYLSNITFPNSITSIGSYAFEDCTGLKGSLIIPNSLNSLGIYAFYRCGSLTNLIIGDSISSIGSYAFASCYSLTNVTIGKSVLSISSTAFKSNNGMKIVRILNNVPPSLEGYWSFSSVVYVPTTASTAYKASTYWSRITIAEEKKVSINNSIPGNLALTLLNSGSGPLPNITHLTVTGNLNGDDLLQMNKIMSVLTEIDLSGATLVEDSLPDNAFFGKETLYTIKLPSTLQIIGSSAFKGTSLHGELPLTASLTKIGDNAFSGCSDLTGGIIIPNAVTSIGSYAFNGCEYLTGNLSIPNSVKSIGSGAFFGCYGLTSTLTIPNSVTSIGSSAFSGCYGLTGSLHISESLTAIEDSTFYSCRNLSGDLRFSDGVTYIGNSAFNGCNSFTGNLIIPNSVTSIGSYAFASCYSFTGNLIIPNSVTSIGNYAFLNCNGFTGNLNIPNSVTSIGSYAFLNCSGFSGSIVFPSGIKKIPSYAFSNCSGINDVTLPLSVESIEGYAFKGCTNLTNLFINKNTTTVGNYAFDGCYSLQKLTVARSTPPIIYSNTFNGVNKTTCSLEVPESSNLTYQTAVYWSQFALVSTLSYQIKLQIGVSGIVMENNKVLADDSTLFVKGGNTKTFLLIPDSGFIVSSLTYNGEDVKSQINNNQYIIPNINDNAILCITFTNAFYINILSGVGGEMKENDIIVENTSKISVIPGKTATFTIYPNQGYEIATLTFNGLNVLPQLVNNQFTTPTIEEDGILSITFQKSRYSLSIKSAESGSVNLLCGYGDTPSFNITISDGWKIHLVTYNGSNVSDSLVNGVYTVPAITENALLSVSFELINAIQATSNNSIKVYTIHSEIIVDGTIDSEEVTLYTIDGVKLTSVKSNGGRISIPVKPDLIYIIKTPSKTVKVAI